MILCLLMDVKLLNISRQAIDETGKIPLPQSRDAQFGRLCKSLSESPQTQSTQNKGYAQFGRLYRIIPKGLSFITPAQ
jgi:hypothetical protein